METVKAELRGILNEFRADMARRDKENTRWLIGVVVTAVAVIIAALRYFAAFPPAG